jgi:hypothetical protein
MTKEELKQKYTLEKVAKGVDLTAEALSAGKKAGSAIVQTGAKFVLLPILLGVPAAAATAGVLASKVSSPEALAKNAEKYILQSALDSEIAVLERQLADEELRRSKQKVKKYDRFV